MHITIDLSPAVHHHAGIGRYAHELTAALTALDRDNEYSAFYNAPRGDERPNPPLDRLPARTLRLAARPWRLRVMLADLLGLTQDQLLPPCDVFHATDHLLPPLSHARTVLTVFDLTFRLFPQHHLPLNRWYSTLMLPRFARRADAILTISENTRRDLLNWIRLPADKVRVTYLGHGPAFRPIDGVTELAHIRARYTLPDQFILYLGTIEPRKNLVMLLDAYEILRRRDEAAPPLILAGRQGWLYESVLQRVRTRGLERHVRLTDWVADEDIPAMMNAAAAFVYPSLYEGFGLPPLEAMACGTPVLCSNTSSLPEVVGDGGLLLDPHDAHAWAAALERILSDEHLRADLRARGLIQARKFSWERAARETLAAYQSIAGKQP
jgi:glycosyltransferase involved in cell wall biosynthesis